MQGFQNMHFWTAGGKLNTGSLARSLSLVNPAHNSQLFTCFRVLSCCQQMELRWRFSLNQRKKRGTRLLPKRPPRKHSDDWTMLFGFPQCFETQHGVLARMPTHNKDVCRSSVCRWTHIGRPASGLHGTCEPLSHRLRQLTAPNSAADGLKENGGKSREETMSKENFERVLRWVTNNTLCGFPYMFSFKTWNVAKNFYFKNRL